MDENKEFKKINLKIKNTGIILEGDIEFKEKTLNIKYRMNGIRKTTMSRAIECHCGIRDPNTLKTHGSNKNPLIEMCDSIKSVKVFNQDYVDKYLFKEEKGDIINNSFELIINTNEYKELTLQLDTTLNDFKVSITSNEILEILSKLEALNTSMKFKDNNQLNGNSTFARGRKISDIEQLLDDNTRQYKNRFISRDNFNWHKWFLEGENYISDNRACPFCNKELEDSFDKTLSGIKTAFTNIHIKQNTELKGKINEAKPFIGKSIADSLIVLDSTSDNLNEKQHSLLFDVNKFLLEEISKLSELISLQNTTIVMIG